MFAFGIAITIIPFLDLSFLIVFLLMELKNVLGGLILIHIDQGSFSFFSGTKRIKIMGLNLLAF